MFATTGKFKRVGSKNNDKNINIPTCVPISIEIVEKLIKQESIKAHDEINQAIKKIGFDSTKLDTAISKKNSRQ